MKTQLKNWMKHKNKICVETREGKEIHRTIGYLEKFDKKWVMIEKDLFFRKGTTLINRDFIIRIGEIGSNVKPKK